MSILDKAVSHFDGLQNRSLEVPEWGVTVYFDMPTLKQRMSWSKMSEARAQATVLIKCLKDETGQPVFEDTPDTMAALQTKVDPRITARLVGAVLGTATPEDMGND
jgi:hypothetical protein